VRGQDVPILQAEALRKSFRGPAGQPIAVLNHVDLRVNGGEYVAIAGPSGAGKSTLLNVLGLLDDPDAGELRVDGHDVSRASRSQKARARGRLIGYVFQSFLLISSLTALENVCLAGRYVGGDRRAALRRAQALLEEFGVAHRRDHYPAQLSGGEQQRVAYCRAVLNEPRLLLADEPTGNLDDEHAVVILDGLRRRAAAGAAVVVVSHRPEPARDADRVLTLKEGVLHAC
jgi:putative ABC transport system ATP-binding protein